MRDAHVAGEVGDALPVGEDLGGHAVALALVHPAALGDGDARGILASLHPGQVVSMCPVSTTPRVRLGHQWVGTTHMLEEVEGLMQVDGRSVGPRVAELWRFPRQ